MMEANVNNCPGGGGDLPQVPDNARELPTVQTAEKLKAVGYRSNFDFLKLYPGVYNLETNPRLRGNPPGLEAVLGNSIEAVQRARRLNGNSAGIERFLAYAGESLDVCIRMREADMEDGLIKELRNWVSSCPVISGQSKANFRVFVCADVGSADSWSKGTTLRAASISDSGTQSRRYRTEPHTTRLISRKRSEPMQGSPLPGMDSGTLSTIGYSPSI
jgi:hypothetical protein